MGNKPCLVCYFLKKKHHGTIACWENFWRSFAQCIDACISSVPLKMSLPLHNFMHSINLYSTCAVFVKYPINPLQNNAPKISHVSCILNQKKISSGKKKPMLFDSFRKSFDPLQSIFRLISVYNAGSVSFSITTPNLWKRTDRHHMDIATYRTNRP